MSMPSESFDAPVLLVEARYRQRTLCARILGAGSPRSFTVGGGRRADAPVDPRYLTVERPSNDNHTLVEPRGAGFVINLSPAMREHARRTRDGLRIPCGEVVFDIRAATPPPRVPRAWLAPGWRGDAKITAAVAFGLLLLLGLVGAVPSDPHALSLDDVGRSVRLDGFRVVPPVSLEPESTRGPAAGGSAPSASARPGGAAGDRTARVVDARRATKGPAVRRNAAAAEAFVRMNTMLAILDGARSGAVADVFARTPALGSAAQTVLAHIEGPIVASAFGPGGLVARGTGAGGADTHGTTLGGGRGLRTIGLHDGPDGHGLDDHGGGDLGHRHTRAPEIITTSSVVRGGLDKEIVRRVVRQHLNEVRFCYEQALVRRPALAGRVVAQFTIAPTGKVLVSALQSSSLGEPTAEACIVAATRRWLFPQPSGGGLVSVSYPFQLSRAGGDAGSP